MMGPLREGPLRTANSRLIFSRHKSSLESIKKRPSLIPKLYGLNESLAQLAKIGLANELGHFYFFGGGDIDEVLKKEYWVAREVIGFEPNSNLDELNLETMDLFPGDSYLSLLKEGIQEEQGHWEDVFLKESLVRSRLPWPAAQAWRLTLEGSGRIFLHHFKEQI